MALEQAKKHLEKWNMEGKVLEFSESSATVELAALAVGCEPARIAKTLSFKVGENPILIVTAGDMKIDNQKYKAQFSSKAKMLTPDEVTEMIGHSVGGVCPFGIKEGVMVYLDASLKRFTSVFPACGSSNSAVEMTLPELQMCSGFDTWIDVCKSMEA